MTKKPQRKAAKKRRKKRKRSSYSSSSSSADCADVKALEDAAKTALERQNVQDKKGFDCAKEAKTNDDKGRSKILKELIAQHQKAIAEGVPPRSASYNTYMREKARDATMQAQFENAKGCKNKRESLRVEWLQNVVEVKKNRAATNPTSGRRGF